MANTKSIYKVAAYFQRKLAIHKLATKPVYKEINVEYYEYEEEALTSEYATYKNNEERVFSDEESAKNFVKKCINKNPKFGFIRISDSVVYPPETSVEEDKKGIIPYAEFDGEVLEGVSASVKETKTTIFITKGFIDFWFPPKGFRNKYYEIDSSFNNDNWIKLKDKKV